jgi:MinD superfamily P-loop ATPase
LTRIAVASGKGGTGKTTIATSLALALDSSQVAFFDCDVEAPNSHLYLKPAYQQREKVGLFIPEIDESVCTFCGKCAEVCQYHAIAVIGKKTLVFPELCHGCGSCTLICPENAIHEKLDVMGILERGFTSTGIDFARGLMDVGEPMAVPIIRQLKKFMDGSNGSREIVILDVPPGTSCPVVESLRGADYVILVTEPTPFGLHDLRLAVQLVRELDIPAGVVLNRDGIGDQAVDDFCRDEGIPILMRVPMDRRIAEALARGQPLIDILPEYGPKFQDLFRQIQTIIAETIIAEKEGGER